MYQMSRPEPVHHKAEPAEIPLEARRAAEEAERKRITERGPGAVKHWWEVVAASRETKARAEAAADAAFNTHQAWHKLIKKRLEQTGRLIDRLREAQVVRARPDLVEELDHLDPTDLNGCLRTAAIVLAEALDRPAAISQPEDYDAWFHSLTTLVEETERARHEVKVAPGPDGRVDGRMPRRSLSGVEVKNSAGVMWGAHNRLDVTHLCVVENPVIEIAELVRVAEDGPVFDLSAWLFRSSPDGGAAGVVLGGSGYWVRISNCTGVTLGNSNDVDLTYTYKMDTCHVNLGLLLRDPKVRADLALMRDDSPANAEQAGAARRRLPQTVARATGAMDLSRLVPEDRIAQQARRPRVRGGGGGLVVSHGAGVVVGLDPAVHSTTVTRIGAFRIKGG